MRFYKYTLALLLLASSILFAQEAETPAPSNLDKLLELVKKEKHKNRQKMLIEKLDLSDHAISNKRF